MSYSSEVKAELAKVAAKDGSDSGRNSLRDVFLRYGFVSDPSCENRLEFTIKSEDEARRIRDEIIALGLKVGLTKRKGSFVVYLKGGDAVSEILSRMGAVASMLKFEAMRVVKKVNNDINRSTNFISANVNKSISASVRQVEDIRLIETTIGLDALPERLCELARARLENPELSLAELGDSLKKTLSKSGVSHRLKELTKIAEKLRATSSPD